MQPFVAAGISRSRESTDISSYWACLGPTSCNPPDLPELPPAINDRIRLDKSPGDRCRWGSRIQICPGDFRARVSLHASPKPQHQPRQLCFSGEILGKRMRAQLWDPVRSRKSCGTTVVSKASRRGAACTQFAHQPVTADSELGTEAHSPSPMRAFGLKMLQKLQVRASKRLRRNGSASTGIPPWLSAHRDPRTHSDPDCVLATSGFDTASR